MLSWYKTLSESFPMIKDMQSPPLSRIQPDFFVKRSLIWYDLIFSYAWKSLSISFCAIAFCRQFYFLFCVKDSLNRKKFVYYPQPTTCLDLYRATWFANIFSRRENFSLFDAWFFVYRCFIVAVSLYIIYIPVILLFILPWKPLSFYANSRTFFFLRENPSLFLIKFLNKINFSDVATLEYLCPVFFFFFVKTSLRSLWISPYIRAFASYAALFFVCVKFSLNKQRQNAIFLIFLRCIVIFCVLQFYFIPVKITLFSA